MQERRGSMDIRLTEEQRAVLAHALREEIEKVEGASGTHYGPLPLPEARSLLWRISGDELDLLTSIKSQKTQTRGGATWQ